METYKLFLITIFPFLLSNCKNAEETLLNEAKIDPNSDRFLELSENIDPRYENEEGNLISQINELNALDQISLRLLSQSASDFDFWINHLVIEKASIEYDLSAHLMVVLRSSVPSEEKKLTFSSLALKNLNGPFFSHYPEAIPDVIVPYLNSDAKQKFIRGELDRLEALSKYKARTGIHPYSKISSPEGKRLRIFNGYTDYSTTEEFNVKTNMLIPFNKAYVSRWKGGVRFETGLTTDYEKAPEIGRQVEEWNDFLIKSKIYRTALEFIVLCAHGDTSRVTMIRAEYAKQMERVSETVATSGEIPTFWGTIGNLNRALKTRQNGGAVNLSFELTTEGAGLLSGGIIKTIDVEKDEESPQHRQLGSAIGGSVGLSLNPDEVGGRYRFQLTYDFIDLGERELRTVNGSFNLDGRFRNYTIRVDDLQNTVTVNGW